MVVFATLVFFAVCSQQWKTWKYSLGSHSVTRRFSTHALMQGQYVS